ncbi:MAG: Uma2 family endonuclease [Phycisphaerae bacterium]
MVTKQRRDVFTFGDFLELVQEHAKADLLDGRIHMASPESIANNDLVGWLYELFAGYVRERRVGHVTVNRVAFRLSHANAPEPDVAFVAAARTGIMRNGYVDGPPDLAVEVVSPESVERDYELKRTKYEEGGVLEYWIIDPEQQRATFLVRDRAADGSLLPFREASIDAGVYHSQTLPGFRLRVEMLWQKPLPSAYRVIGELLGAS